jgi:PAS domain-containing protein
MAEDCPELIVMRQLASYLAMPIFVQDRDGDLVYFNEPAEPILGRRFDETGSLTRKELWELFRPRHDDGSPLEAGESPFVTAREGGEAVHRRFRLKGMDGILREIEGTAIPLTNREGEIVGDFAVFWESRPDDLDEGDGSIS